MRKRVIGQDSSQPSDAQPWLDLEQLAVVEVSSEADDYPVEAALMPGMSTGWRAAVPGMQTIRLLFDEPQHLRQIRLVFHEERQARTQEFVLRWSPDGGKSYREIVRQQYTFSPPSTISQIEDYTVGLDSVTVIALELVPDISGGNAIASLQSLQLA